MSNRRNLALIGVCAALACANMARASEPQQPTLGQGLSLAAPVYADTAPKPALMSLLDQTPLGSLMTQYDLSAGGFVEASWTYNFSRPDNQTNVGRVFDYEDQDITLNQVDVYVEKALKGTNLWDFGGRIEWIWGGDARGIHANGVFDHYGIPIFQGSPATFDGPDEQFDPVQFYLTGNIPIGNGIHTTWGKFVTPFGYETINPTTNPLYSHSYLFGFAIPFTHWGSKYEYEFDKSLKVMVGYVRGWDQVFEDNNANWYSYMGQVTYTTDKLDLILGVITGPEQLDNHSDYRTVIDGIAVYRASDQLQLVVNADYGWEADANPRGGTATWCGIAGYAMYKITDQFTLVGRAEYFNDHDGSRGLGTTVYECTVGLNIKPMPSDRWMSGLVLRPELRWDHAADNIFNDGDDENQYTFGIDAIYAF